MRKIELTRIAPGLAALALAAVTIHCGGGGIGGSGGISGFGSVFVNGIEWFTDSAEITLDGVPATEADLRIGMIVELDGDSLSATTAEASRVSFDDEVQGGVDLVVPIDASTKEVAILGHSVRLQQGFTVFDDSDPAFGFHSVAVDDVLEVSGHRDGEGAIVATWVRRLGVVAYGATPVELEGAVAALVPGTSFLLGPVGVLMDPSTDLSGLQGPLANGSEVEVEGVLLAAGLVHAASVSDREEPPQQIQNFSLEGLVGDFVSLSDFRVAGQRVNAAQAVFTPADPAFVTNGALIEVEGPILGGVLVADEVELELPEVRAEAELASSADVDPAAGTVVLLGVTFTLATDADLEDERDEVDDFGLDDLADGDFLAIEGYEHPDGSLVATSLVRDTRADVLLSGPLTGFDELAGEIEICGAVIAVDATTDLTDDDDGFGSLAEFFAALEVGREASVIDLRDGDETAIDVADSVELED